MVYPRQINACDYVKTFGIKRPEELKNTLMEKTYNTCFLWFYTKIDKNGTLIVRFRYQSVRQCFKIFFHQVYLSKDLLLFLNR